MFFEKKFDVMPTSFPVLKNRHVIVKEGQTISTYPHFNFDLIANKRQRLVVEFRLKNIV